MDITAFNQPGMQIIHHADEGLTRTAAQVARGVARVDERSEELETVMVKSLTYEQQGYAGVKVVRAADEILGSLLNVRS